MARRRRMLLFAIVLLYAASIPWYRPAGARPELWLGLPDWVTVALGCYVAVAVLNALAWWWTDIPDPPRPPAPRAPEAGSEEGPAHGAARGAPPEAGA